MSSIGSVSFSFSSLSYDSASFEIRMMIEDIYLGNWKVLMEIYEKTDFFLCCQNHEFFHLLEAHILCKDNERAIFFVQKLLENPKMEDLTQEELDQIAQSGETKERLHEDFYETSLFPKKEYASQSQIEARLSLFFYSVHAERLSIECVERLRKIYCHDKKLTQRFDELEKKTRFGKGCDIG